jgi:hypothetical protein
VRLGSRVSAPRGKEGPGRAPYMGRPEGSGTSHGEVVLVVGLTSFIHSTTEM